MFVSFLSENKIKEAVYNVRKGAGMHGKRMTPLSSKHKNTNNFQYINNNNDTSSIHDMI